MITSLTIVMASSVFRYQEHVVWGDKALNLKLLRKGILTRIYAPMVSVNCETSSVFTIYISFKR